LSLFRSGWEGGGPRIKKGSQISSKKEKNYLFCESSSRVGGGNIRNESGGLNRLGTGGPNVTSVQTKKMVRRRKGGQIFPIEFKGTGYNEGQPFKRQNTAKRDTKRKKEVLSWHLPK